MNTSTESIQSVVVVDVGATNTYIAQYAPNFDLIARRSRETPRYDGADYACLAVEDTVRFARQTIADLDREVPVDVIVPCTHGSAIALLDETQELVFPVMSYLSPVPEDVAKAYARIEPAFSEVFAPTNPGALTLARQILWLEMAHPAAFARVREILPYAQYMAFRLCGVTSSEMTSLGAQSHLWAPQRADFSALAKSRGWADLVAPLTPAARVLGPAQALPLTGRGQVLCGIHDSSASYLQFAHLEPLVLLSTGTWIIAFDSGADLDTLDPSRDQVANVKIDGTPIASARFMGGEEFRRIAGQDNTATPSIETVVALITAGVMALPSFTVSGGPMPDTGGRGRILGKTDLSAPERISLATLYTAMMTAFTLDRLGDTRRVVVDGVFAENAVFVALLDALLPNRDILAAHGDAGSARGAALLALPGRMADIPLAPAPKLHIDGLADYYAMWVHNAQNTTGGEQDAF